MATIIIFKGVFKKVDFFDLFYEWLTKLHQVSDLERKAL